MLQGYYGHVLAGALVTLQIALASLMLATLLGLLGASLRLSRWRLLSASAAVYVTLIRGVPDLVLMLLFFYGGQVVVNHLLQAVGVTAWVQFEPFSAGVATLGFIYGAYLTEVFRGALLAIPPGQAEAGQAFGFSRRQVFTGISLPQMVRLALPGYLNLWLVIAKSSALVSVIGLQDLMYRAREAGAATREPFTYLLFAGTIYLAITTVSLWAARWADRRYSAGVRMGVV